MRYTKDIQELGLPSGFKFGIEIEADNVQTKGDSGLYGGESATFIKGKRWHMASKQEESLVAHGGAELVSPILTDSKHDWKAIFDICDHIKKYPGKSGSEVVADDKCGLHIHFDSECITSSPDRYRNFMRLYAEAEELIYKMCNDKSDPLRRGAINKSYKGLQLVSSIWRKGMASPSSKRILKQIEDGTLKVSHKKFGRLRRLVSKYKLDERRYHGLNLTNIGNVKKNTIEFRMANGTLDPEVIRQNVFLYGSLLNTAIQMTEHPEEYAERLSEFYRTDVTEEQKAQSFVSLIMDNPEDRQIYMERWQSVKDAEVFSKNEQKGFAQGRFQRESFKKIALRTPADRVKAAYSHIKGLLTKTKEKEETNHDR